MAAQTRVAAGVREGLPHYWNQMPGGRWFDATAAMFGDDGPTVTDQGNLRYAFRERVEPFRIR